jgi:hypothetical protein
MHYAMKTYRGVGVFIHIFLTLALAGREWLASRPARFTAGERAPNTHWMGGWVDPRVGLDDVERITFLTLPGLELRTQVRPAPSQSLYRLHYTKSEENAWSSKWTRSQLEIYVKCYTNTIR